MMCSRGGKRMALNFLAIIVGISSTPTDEVLERDLT